jgi:pyruvate dehydrogenase E2 component (dihydrolipoamide acetyltransferase)
MVTFAMPALGADMDHGTVVQWLVKPGDTVHRGDILAVVDTEKSAVDAESFTDGVVERILVEPGRKVPVGTPLATLTGTDDEGPASAVPPDPRTPEPRMAEPPMAQPPVTRPPEFPAAGAPAADGSGLVGSPLLRRLARQRGIDLRAISGTGPGGAVTRADLDRIRSDTGGPAPTDPSAAPARIPASPLARRLAERAGFDIRALAATGTPVHAEDVRRAITAATAVPTVDSRVDSTSVPTGTAEPDRRESMRRAIARLMTTSHAEIPHYYVSATVNLQACLDWLSERNRDLEVTHRLVPAALLLKASAVAARQTDGLNGQWREDRFVPAAAVHLGVVTAVRSGGLMVPVIHDADTLPVAVLMSELRGVVERVRFGRPRSSDLTGATLTVTNLGDLGADDVQGLIFPPQVALVGFGAVLRRPWVVDEKILVRPVVTVTLAADHRVSDGMVGARFLHRIDRLLQRPGEL